MIEKIYNPREIEQPLYNWWEKRGYFKPNEDPIKEPFCIMIPPPNITGNLHIGHAFQQTIMDIIIRYQRMRGKNTLWQFGTDHAGIATQMIVERTIATKEGKTRYDYGRDAFVKKIWKWKLRYNNTINYQMRRLGNSVDWGKERFTMDEGFARAVREVFIVLYKEKLIYRSKRLVNWDLKLRTAVSDLEVEHRKTNGFMWYIRYPLADNEKTTDGKNYLIVATTRPETILGDTGVAVNPEDLRYKNLIGKFVILPLANRRIPIVGDKRVNTNKGVGCLKITPAHDFNDYEIGQYHKLPIINILTFDGSIRENAEVFDTKGNKSDVYSTKIPNEFQKLDHLTARKVIIEAIKRLNLLEEIQPHNSIVPYSNRSEVIIEPMLTDQWYISIDSLSKPAIEAVENGNIQFIPKKYENMYFSWMRNIRDWCISRQLWWGHRIPAWYDNQGNIFVGHNEEEIRKENNIPNNITLHQDEDVLDTWFSSALWTFSALGWPENTETLRKFHPTSVIVSGFDIIFFWIARMIMMTMYFIKDENGQPQVPFKIVYITGLVRDNKGKKMSKSKGNIIDPLDIVDGIALKNVLEKHTSNMTQSNLAKNINNHTKKQLSSNIKSCGADALRFTLAALATTGRDINWDVKRLIGYRNFCNKLWNASNFVLKNTINQDCNLTDEGKNVLLANRWILSEFNQTVKIYREALDNFRFDIAAGIVYEFTWNNFCDWYIEFTKSIMTFSSKSEICSTRYTLITVLEALLRLAHPIIPFITETIWQQVKTVLNIKTDTIMLQPFPKFNTALIDEKASADIVWLKQLITAVRSIRVAMNIAQNKPIKLLLRNYNDEIISLINENHVFLRTMANIKNISTLSVNENAPISLIKIINGVEILIPMADLIDNKTMELKRLTKEILKLELKINYTQTKLANRVFVTRAPKEIIDREHTKLTMYIEEKMKLIEQQAIIAAL